MKTSVSELKEIAKKVRIDVIEMIHQVQSGHPGGSLSAVDILISLYFVMMNIDPDNPNWELRDRFILSKAHDCPGLYAVLARRGFFPVEELSSFRRLNSRLQGHAHLGTPGVEMNGGSLGQGLSAGLGMALAANLDKKNNYIYVMLGDGELNEGQIWEAAMAASHYSADNLTAIVDRNRIQNDRFTHEVMELEPLKEKWEAFGWDVRECDGHDFNDIINQLQLAKEVNGKPSLIIANTVKGKGVSFMENNPDFHGKATNDEQYEQAMKELR